MAGGLIRIKVTLHSYLKEYLPPEKDGHTELELPEGTSIANVALQLGLPALKAAAVNETIERDHQRILQDGDHLRFLRPGAGG